MIRNGTVIITVMLILLCGCEIMPRNTMNDCWLQCDDNPKSKACLEFCDCIHLEGKPLDSCLDKYETAAPDSLRAQKAANDLSRLNKAATN